MMKIGTKANAIDDLGKFDGSKMTIKVNGKQIYPQKRYALVRVDGHCPNRFEAVLNENVCKTDKNGECYSRCSESRYGDTKEQKILQVAQAIRIISKELNRSNITMTEEQIFKTTAKFIVEFLGVEE